MASGGGPPDGPTISVNIVMQARGYARAMAQIRRENDLTERSLNRLTAAFQRTNTAANNVGGGGGGWPGGGGGGGGRRRPGGGAGPAGWGGGGAPPGGGGGWYGGGGFGTPQTAGGGGQNYQRGGITRGGAVGPVLYDLGSLLIGRGAMTDINRMINVMNVLPARLSAVGAAAYIAARGFGAMREAMVNAMMAGEAMGRGPGHQQTFMTALERGAVSNAQTQDRIPQQQLGRWQTGVSYYLAAFDVGGWMSNGWRQTVQNQLQATRRFNIQEGRYTGAVVGPSFTGTGYAPSAARRGELARQMYAANARDDLIVGPPGAVRNVPDIDDPLRGYNVPLGPSAQTPLGPGNERGRLAAIRGQSILRGQQFRAFQGAINNIYGAQNQVGVAQQNLAAQTYMANLMARGGTRQLNLIERGSAEDIARTAQQGRRDDDAIVLQKQLQEQQATRIAAQGIITAIREVAPLPYTGL